MRRFRVRHRTRFSLLTPSGLIVRAALGVLAFIVLHAIGFRAYTTLLSGTSPTGEQVAYVDMLKMVAYVLSYLFSTVVAPILLIAAAALAVLQRKFITCEQSLEERDDLPESADATAAGDPQMEGTSES
jgi:hypothetical protein